VDSGSEADDDKISPDNYLFKRIAIFVAVDIDAYKRPAVIFDQDVSIWRPKARRNRTDAQRLDMIPWRVGEIFERGCDHWRLESALLVKRRQR